MPNKADILWFKLQFGSQIERATRSTPFDLDMLTAIACQETGYIWSVLRRKGLAVNDILALCVGDTLDASGGRAAFPKTYEELIAAPNGAAMFQVARHALVNMAAHIPSYAGAARSPRKFCHGFGIFQSDLQFFKTNPDYFLLRRYAEFGVCVELCLEELDRGLSKLGWKGRSRISDLEMAQLAIVYNTGRYRPERGLKQGYKSDDGRYYGEAYYAFLLKAREVALPTDQPGLAAIPAPASVTADGDVFEVDTREGLLNLRASPERDPAAPSANVKAGLPDGHLVRSLGMPSRDGYIEIETTLSGALLRGFVAQSFLKPRAASAWKASSVPLAPPSGLTAVRMPRKPGRITRRTEPAGAHSLNESGMPGRKGSTPTELTRELTAIIEWLGVENPAHTRYQPRDGLTFCNIYAHDYCHLAGVYLPRVWWSPGALLAIGRGEIVTPQYGATIEEVRANGLFRWLRDFGPQFGWRRTGALGKLQTHANQGGIGVVVARRKEDGRSGHIVVVPPETDAHQAVREPSGEVTAPLQSQAGSHNFAYGTKAGWWTDDQFAESGFWIHA